MRNQQISVVVPSFNGARYLGQTLESLLAQEYEGWSAVVTDDGSLDATPRVAATYAGKDRRIRWIRQSNRGAAAARNMGFSASDPDCPFILFLDHDDILEPHALDTLLARLESEPAAAAAYGQISLIDAEGHASGWIGSDRPAADTANLPAPLVAGDQVVWVPHRPLEDFNRSVTGNALCTPGAVLFRKAFLPPGPFRSKYRNCEDWDMFLRTSRTHSFAFVDRVVLRYRLHEAAKSRNGRGMAHYQAEVRRDAIEDPANTAEQRRVAQTAWRYFAQQAFKDRLASARAHFAEAHLLTSAREFRLAMRYLAAVDQYYI